MTRDRDLYLVWSREREDDEGFDPFDYSVGQPWDEIFMQIEQNKAGLLMALAYIVAAVVCTVAA